MRTDDPEGVAADVAALARMARGDESGLAELYDRHATPVYSLALRIVRRPEDAEDVTQQVFTQAWRTSARFDQSRGVVAAWLLMIARSRAIDCLRRRNPARDGISDDERLAAIPDPEPSVEYVVATREQVERVQVAIDALPAEQRVAVELAYYDGLTQSEIAERTSTPLGTVKTRVRSALQTLRSAVAVARGAAGGQS
ncbi:MAG: sigma-70 family RNA polymerase sigma factor [Acidobacteria bacterium]|nr:sigma-70 family RNA polymerase sigma factor [Acidobacteriota bacterium]